MIVFKFGGSSVATNWGVKCIEKILKNFNEPKIIVFSAIGKSCENDIKLTDRLLLLCNLKKAGLPITDCVNDIIKVIERYQDNMIKSHKKPINISNLKEFLLKEDDFSCILATGEFCTCKILAYRLNLQFIDACSFLKADENGLSLEKTKSAFNRFYIKKDIAVPGFYYEKNGKLCIMERGGGDITGSFIAETLNAKIYYNCTDVNGLLSSGYFKSFGKTIPNLSYGQLMSLEKSGINLFSPLAIQYLVDKEITLYIKNTFDFFGEATKVTKSFSPCFLFQEKLKCKVFHNTEKHSNNSFLKGILKSFMIFDKGVYSMFFNDKELVVYGKDSWINEYKDLLDLYILVIFGEKFQKVLFDIKLLSKIFKVKCKTRELPYPFLKTEIFFYGHIDEIFLSEIYKLINDNKIKYNKKRTTKNF